MAASLAASLASLTASVASETEHLTELRVEFLERELNGVLAIKVEDKVGPKYGVLRRGEEKRKVLLGLGFVKEMGVGEWVKAMMVFSIAPSLALTVARERE